MNDHASSFRPPSLTAKQDQIICMVSRSIAHSVDPARFLEVILETTKYNHNFAFLSEGNPANNYYRCMLHFYLKSAQQGYNSQDQFSGAYEQQLQQQQYQQQPSRIRNRSDVAAGSSSEPYAKVGRTETGRPDQGLLATPADNQDDDDDGAPQMRIVVDENGVQQIVPA